MKLAKYVIGVTAFTFSLAAQSTPFTEGFDNIGNLAGNGWVQTNNSTTPTGSWFQGNSGVFDSHSGAANSYIGNNFLAGGGSSIDTWLISPELMLNVGSVLRFWTRTELNDFQDQVQVYFHAGSSSNVSDFTNLLLTIPGGQYPFDWTEFTAALPDDVSGRFAFRYIVADAVNDANYIGIDTVSVSVNNVPEPSTYVLLALGLAGLAIARRRQRGGPGRV